jgi:hypothetical protein
MPQTHAMVAAVSKERHSMNDQTDHLDQTDEEILTATVSDEIMEAAAGTELLNPTWTPAVHCAPSGGCI